MMGIKRKLEEMDFSTESFLKKLQDPETSFLALSEFNEHIRDHPSEEFLAKVNFNFSEIAALITEEKRKASENITLYRFLTTLLMHFSQHSEVLLKKFTSIPNSIQTIYFMLSSHTTASHLKVTLKFLCALTQQNEYYTRLIFTSMDFKRPFWKSLFKRRDIRDPEDVRYWAVKFFLSPLIYQNPDLTRHLLKEQDIFHEIFVGLQHDPQATVEFVLHDLQMNIVMLAGMNKTDKLHLFNDRNLKALLKSYQWKGPQRQKRKKEEEEEEEEQEEGEEKNEEVRKMLHTFLMIVLNSKNYGIAFFDPTFGTSTKNSNPILLKVVTSLLPHASTDEYQANLLVHCLRTCPDLLPSFFKLTVDQKIPALLIEVLQQQKPLLTWLDIFQSQPDPLKLVDIFIHLTIPIDLLKKFEYSTSTFEFLCLILDRVQQAFDILTTSPLACPRATAVEGYQQAILRYLPKPDASLALTPEYLRVLKFYSSGCFLLHGNFEVLLSHSLLNLLGFFAREVEGIDPAILQDYFHCLTNLLATRESIDDVTWARQNKDLHSTPLRILLAISKQMPQLDAISTDLGAILAKFSSMLSSSTGELKIWIYTWLKLGKDEEVEKLLSATIEKIILNPYPILEKQMKNTEYSLMIYSALENLPTSPVVDQYLCQVLVQIYIDPLSRPSGNLHEHLVKLYLRDREETKIARLLRDFSPGEEIQAMGKKILGEIDLVQGPDRYQINLAMKLNLYQIFTSGDEQRLIQEVIQCLNLVLLLHDPHRDFAEVFDRMMDYMQSYSSERMLDLLLQIITGLDRTHFTPEPLRNSATLFDCLQIHSSNAPLIHFLFYYLSSEYRLEYLHHAAHAAHLDILLAEIQSNPGVAHENFLDLLIDHVHFDLQRTLPCVLELIRRLQVNGENTLRLKQKKIFKLAKVNYENEQSRSLVAKLIVQTVLALRLEDRAKAVERLVEKSASGLLLHAYVFRELIERELMSENEAFVGYLREVLKEHGEAAIVFDLLKASKLKGEIMGVLQEEGDFLQQTNDLHLFLKLYPAELTIGKSIYQAILKQISKDSITDRWLLTFNQCTITLLPQIELDFDFKDLINHLLKTFSIPSLTLLKNLLTGKTYQPKSFAKFLKHPHFLSTLSSPHRAVLLDILARFVSFYQTNQSSIAIDCSKHFPMLLSIYTPTLSLNDQHAFACMYQYEKSGYVMKREFLWGEAAVKDAGQMGNGLMKKSKLEEVMGLLDEKMMKRSIEFYPVTRRLRTIEPNTYEHGNEIYDPAYLIPVFYHSLGSESLVKCQDFIEKHCLSYCLMALSSRCALLRAVVYNCLVRFEEHLLPQRFYCKEQILTLFNLLRQSVKKSNLKLAPIVALFLARLVELFTHPESRIYRTITRFLLKQPFIDLVHIPLFAELFHSSSVEYKYERHWILSLLKTGIKDSIDYTLCSKAYVFKTLMTFYDCSLCDQITKMEILQVFHSLSKLQEVLMPLLFDYGFLLWLQMGIRKCSSESLLVLSLIIENIGKRLASSDHQVQLMEFSGVLMVFVRRLRNETNLSSALVDPLVSTLVEYQKTTKFGDLKFLVDCSTVEQKMSLLSCFC